LPIGFAEFSGRTAHLKVRLYVRKASTTTLNVAADLQTISNVAADLPAFAKAPARLAIAPKARGRQVRRRGALRS
jgi:hypothetical protein